MAAWGADHPTPGPHHGPHPSGLSPHIWRDFHTPTLALASPHMCWYSLHQHPSSLGKRCMSGKIGNVRAQWLKRAGVGGLCKPSFQFPLAACLIICFFDLPPARNSALCWGSPGPSPGLPKPSSCIHSAGRASAGLLWKAVAFIIRFHEQPLWKTQMKLQVVQKPESRHVLSGWEFH